MTALTMSESVIFEQSGCWGSGWGTGCGVRPRVATEPIAKHEASAVTNTSVLIKDCFDMCTLLVKRDRLRPAGGWLDRVRRAVSAFQLSRDRLQLVRRPMCSNPPVVFPAVPIFTCSLEEWQARSAALVLLDDLVCTSVTCGSLKAKTLQLRTTGIYRSPLSTMLSVSRVAPMYTAPDTRVGEPGGIASTGSSCSVSVMAM